jgi:hypothetical protein
LSPGVKELDKEILLLVEMDKEKKRISLTIPWVYHLIDKEIFMSPIIIIIEYKDSILIEIEMDSVESGLL